MLAQLGPVIFSVAPLNYNETRHEAGADFASHDVLGSHPFLEFMGEAQEEWTVSGTIFPGRDGPVGQFDALIAMSKSGVAQFFMLGSGVPRGWVVLTRITEKASYIAANGEGRVIEFDVTLKRAPRPSPAAIFSTLVSIFQ